MPSSTLLEPTSTAEWLGAISDYQAELLADGTVDFGEYQAAVFATADCMRIAGVEVDGPFQQSDDIDHGVHYYYGGEIDKSRLYAWIVSSPTTGGLDAALEVQQDCAAEFLDAVEWTWSRSIAASVAEVDQYYLDVKECLELNAIDIGDGSREVIDDAVTLHFLTGCS